MSSFLKYLYTLPAVLVTAVMAPTIFARWRGKPQAVEAAKPTEEEQAQQRELLQKTVQDAVAAALNTEAFTKAVAVHLASELQPSLKAALDTSAIDTKIVESNEQLSQRIDTSNSETASKLSELSTLINTNNTTSANKISAVEGALAQITASLADLGKNVGTIQEQVASPDTSLLASHGEKLDTISTTLHTLYEQGPAPVSTALASHATKLDAIIAELTLLKDNTETAASLKNIISEVGSLKQDLEAGTSAGFSGIGTQVGAVLAAVEAQNTTLAEIKAADASSEILASIKTSNDSHTAHVTALAGLKASTDANSPALAEIDSNWCYQ